MATRFPDKRNIQNMPSRDFKDFETLAKEQGVKPVQRFEDLLGDFWPEDEDIEEFLATIRRWRQEGSRSTEL